MNPNDLFPHRWRTLFHPDREFVLRWLTPSQRAALEAQMLADANDAIHRLLEQDDGRREA